jgi:2-keto-3-deoxy-L-rhamnonate aldolase RhmA
MNERVAVIAQIESIKGVENAEEIISAAGVDGVMIGIGDLRMDMNLALDVSVLCDIFSNNI